jgi:hypothetical protein
VTWGVKWFGSPVQLQDLKSLVQLKKLQSRSQNIFRDSERRIGEAVVMKRGRALNISGMASEVEFTDTLLPVRSKAARAVTEGLDSRLTEVF